MKTTNLIRRMGISPSLREIAKDTGTSPNAVRAALLILERKGWIERANNKARTIRILRQIH